MKALNTKEFLLNEGLEDRAEIIAGRAAMARRKEGEYDMEKEKKFRARRKAERIGLVYWPALLDDLGVDPWAYVYAEEVLMEKHLPWGETDAAGGRVHGGWDSQSHYGIAPANVATAWRLAGCRNSAKFRWLIREWNQAGWGRGWPVKVMKAHSVQDLEAMGRGWRHIDLHCEADAIYSGKVLKFLGRCSARTREALLTGLGAHMASHTRRVVRIRDLNFDQVQAYMAAPAQHKVLWDPIRTQEWVRRSVGPTTDLEPTHIAPAFAGASWEDAKALSRGMKPVRLVPGACRAEAHAALTDPRYLEVGLARWLTEQLGHGQDVRSAEVSRWLGWQHQNGKWGQLTRIRTARGPMGAERQFRFLDIIDEVDDADIHSVKDRAEVVFERAAARLEAAQIAREKDMDDVLATPPKWAVDVDGVRPLITRRMLKAEGSEQGHCVAGYWQSTKRRQSICLAIETWEGRTTAEVSWDGKTVFQHRSQGNGDAMNANDRLLSEILPYRNGRVA